MWIFTNDAMVSVVKFAGSSTDVLVRARVQGDIERFFDKVNADLNVEFDETADYPFRARVSRIRFLHALVNAGLDVNYLNFKESITNRHRYQAYWYVWTVLLDKLQTINSLYKRYAKGLVREGNKHRRSIKAKVAGRDY